MKINNINSQVRFRYNAEYHRKFQDNLSNRKSQPEIAKTLVDLDKASLKLEDEIVAMENSKKDCLRSEKYRNMTDLLSEMKGIIGYYSAINFNPLKYCDNVIKQYYIESIQKDDMKISDWRMKICEKLAYYTTDYFGANFSNLKKEQYVGEINEDTFKPKDEPKANNEEPANTPEEKEKEKTLDDVAQQAIDNYIEKTGEKLVSLYKPTQSSPRGFKDVVGLEKLKGELKEEIIEYIINPELLTQDFEEYGIRPPKGYLFWGPPGCGKTFIAQALAQESGMQMYRLDVSKIGSKFVNQSANNIEGAFEYLKYKASSEDRPILLFMDEVDSLAKNRNGASGDSSEDLKVVTTLLKHVEEARDNNIIVIAATNKFDLLDEAFVSRFDGQKYIGLPKKEQIADLIKKNLLTKSKGKELSLEKEEIDKLAEGFIGLSNRTIVFVLDNAAKIAKKDNRSEIKAKHIEQALKESQFDKIDESKYQKNRKKTVKIGFSN